MSVNPENFSARDEIFAEKVRDMGRSLEALHQRLAEKKPEPGATPDLTWPIRLTIPGSPIIKKNRRPIYRKAGSERPFVGKSAALESWEEKALWALRRQLRGPLLRVKLTLPLIATFFFYRREKVEAPGDLSNYYEAPQDALQAVGLLEDDKCIRGHDGSRLLQDAKHPRTELLLWPLGQCPYEADATPFF